MVLSCPGSQLGALKYIGPAGDQDYPPTNGLVNVISCRSYIVPSSVCESEWAAIKAQESVKRALISASCRRPLLPSLIISLCNGIHGHENALPLDI